MIECDYTQQVANEFSSWNIPDTELFPWHWCLSLINKSQVLTIQLDCQCRCCACLTRALKHLRESKSGPIPSRTIRLGRPRSSETSGIVDVLSITNDLMSRSVSIEKHTRGRIFKKKLTVWGKLGWEVIGVWFMLAFKWRVKAEAGTLQSCRSVWQSNLRFQYFLTTWIRTLAHTMTELPPNLHALHEDGTKHTLFR